MPRIAIDMDEVMADALGSIIKHYNERFQHNLTKEDLIGLELRDKLPVEHFPFIRDLLATEEFFAQLEVMDGAQVVIERLSRHYEIFITTAAMEVPSSLRPKFHWLQEHFPFIDKLNYIFCGHKFVVAADYLIDDNARHFKTFTGTGILFDAPHNRLLTGYARARSWHDMESLLSTLENKQPVATLSSASFQTFTS